MRFPIYNNDVVAAHKAVTRRQTLLDLAIIVALIAAAVAIVSHGPSTTYAYAQLNNIGTAMAMEQSGNWLTPMNQVGNLPRKPPLTAWITGAILKISGQYTDFVFRIPTILAAVVCAGLIYFLARRWHGRVVGLLAACFWVAMLHMSKQFYVALTDMMLTMWITLAVFCADRILFHRRSCRAGRWIVGFWLAMIMSAMTKGWGMVGLAVVGGMVCLAAAVGPGFVAISAIDEFGGKIVLIVRLMVRRIFSALRAMKIFWGLAAMAVAVAIVLGAMLMHGGKEFTRDAIGFEIIQRITGGGDSPPKPGRVPPAIQLLYVTLPASVFALASLALVPIGKWFSLKSPLLLPLSWIIATVVPFTIPAGFRPDYLLPCYGAVAILGAWTVNEVATRGKVGGKVVSLLRHVVAAAPVIIGVAICMIGSIYMFNSAMPEWIARNKNIAIPFMVADETWPMLWGVMVLGAAAFVCGIAASLAWRIRTVAAIGIVAMLGVFFLDTHFLSPAARTCDGEKMRQFAMQARPTVGSQQYMVHSAEKLSVELYMGHFGKLLEYKTDVAPDSAGAQRPQLWVRSSGAKWLITTDRGLLALGAAQRSADGDYRISIAAEGQKSNFIVRPELLGRVVQQSPAIYSQGWGRIYLIELREDFPVAMPSKPIDTGFVPGDPGE